MTTAAKLTFLLVFGCFSCSTGDNSTESKNTKSVDTTHQVRTDIATNNIDTIPRFTVDDYPVANQMLDDTASDYSSYPKQSGAIHSSDKAWFKNNALNQTLVFEMYTDKHRLVTFHFYINDIPNAIIERMELHNSDGELATLEQKKQSFKGFVNTATKIDSKYFTTDKGLKLGDDKEKALSVYGTPDNRSNVGGVEMLEWDFVGDILYDGKTDLKGKPLAKDNYGHQATLFFKKNKLIAIILHNDIP